MILPSGVYTIANAVNYNWAFLLKSDDRDNVSAGSNAHRDAGEKWVIEGLSNKNYLLQNEHYLNHASYEFTDTLADKAYVLSISRGTPGEWRIKLVKKPDYYLISDLFGRCWSLWNDIPCTPITLEEYKCNDRQHWNIRVVQYCGQDVDPDDCKMISSCTSVLNHSESAIPNQSMGNVPIPMSRTSEVVSMVDITANLISKIVLLLNNNSHKFRDLILELESLSLTLHLTGSAIQIFEHTSLDQRLADVINPEIRQCFLVLQEVFDIINRYKHALQSTCINYLWSQVCWNGWDRDELIRLRLKLSAHQKSLDGLLVALNSVEWTKFGNQLRSGHASLQAFLAALRQRIPFLGHIPLITVWVVDHLGGRLQVPLLFCSTWKDFNYFLNVYCNDRAGNHFIRRGDYQMIRAQDGQMICPSQFAKPGMVIEISIILRQKVAFQDNKNTCPRCRYVNSNVIDTYGWIECRRCSGLFQVAKAAEEIISPAAYTHNVDSWGMQHASHYADKEAVLASRLRDIQVKLDAARQGERAKREATMAREREAALAKERVERLEAEVAARLAELAELDDDDDDDEAENANAG